eukprot:TRINITY_DN31468_c0_g1_i1.p1 TRINITY_DN31468_c0_g1~~TRINITY_DN31468_c0_g1_i1.p1  ORF type:complete len:171 (-),score=21.31 TRINITY_DN31468_c0_g1_i1:66-578(-)
MDIHGNGRVGPTEFAAHLETTLPRDKHEFETVIVQFMQVAAHCKETAEISSLQHELHQTQQRLMASPRRERRGSPLRKRADQLDQSIASRRRGLSLPGQLPPPERPAAAPSWFKRVNQHSVNNNKKVAASIKIQAAWRGYQVRKTAYELMHKALLRWNHAELPAALGAWG